MDNLLFHFRFSLRRSFDSGLQFLKPNFKHHPLNYVFVVVFFFVGFFPAQAFAESYYWFISGSSTQYSSASAGGSGYCGSIGLDYMTVQSPDVQKAYCSSGGYVGTVNRGVCPQGSTTPACSPDPDPEECVKDEYKLISYKTVKTSSGADTGGITITPKPTSFGDCVYTTTGIATNDDYPDPDYSDSTVECFTETEGSTDVTCYHQTWMQNTGDAPAPDLEVTEQEDMPDISPVKDGDHTEKETSETTNQPTATETMPDGTTVTQDVTTTISTKGKGTNVETTTEEKKIVRDNGITKSQTTVTTTTTNPDGSKSVVTETDTAYEQTDKELIIVKNADGSLSVVKNPGYGGSSKTKNTKNYDADGNKTSESDEKEAEGEQEGEGFCADNPKHVDCKKRPAAGKGFYEPAGTSLEDVFKGFKTKLDESDIGESLTGFYDINVGGTCPRWSVDIWVFQFDLDQMCSPMMIQALGWAAYVILAAASFLAFRIAFL